MSKKKDTQEEPADGLLVTAAKTVGKAAGEIASVVSGSTSRPSKKKGTRPVKKKKTGLPRKAKKAAKKAAQLKT
jgi:microcompartment protein CcmK/EutM